MKILFIIAYLSISSVCSTVSAQDVESSEAASARSIVESVRNAYQRLDYDAAESQALSALDQFKRFNTEQLVELNVILAVINYARNDTNGSEAFFLSALSLDPSLELDPLLFSPKILSFFGEVKSDSESRRAGNSDSESDYIRYLVLKDARPDAALHSMIAPGWGHLRLERRAKGRILLGAWIITATGTIVSHFVAKSAESDYLNETNPDLVEEKYDRYNTWHKTRNAFAITAAAVWVYSLFDILLSNPSVPDQEETRRFNLSASHNSLSFELRF